MNLRRFICLLLDLVSFYESFLAEPRADALAGFELTARVARADRHAVVVAANLEARLVLRADKGMDFFRLGREHAVVPGVLDENRRLADRWSAALHRCVGRKRRPVRQPALRRADASEAHAAVVG